MSLSDDERRRFARTSPGADIDIIIDGSALRTARVIDVSLGGAFVELDVGVVPPALGVAALARVKRSGAEVERRARIVRVRWGGRERGKSVPPAVAVAFDDNDADAATHLATLLTL